MKIIQMWILKQLILYLLNCKSLYDFLGHQTARKTFHTADNHTRSLRCELVFVSSGDQTVTASFLLWTVYPFTPLWVIVVPSGYQSVGRTLPHCKQSYSFQPSVNHHVRIQVTRLSKYVSQWEQENCSYMVVTMVYLRFFRGPKYLFTLEREVFHP